MPASLRWCLGDAHPGRHRAGTANHRPYFGDDGRRRSHRPGDTERRVPAEVVNRNDDIGHLADVFNAMVEKLESWNAVLDREVRKRTVELNAEKAGGTALSRYRRGHAAGTGPQRPDHDDQSGRQGHPGATESDVVGRDWFASFVPERLRATVRDVFLRLMTGETEIVRNYENPVIRLDGGEREIAWRNILITDEAGRAQAFCLRHRYHRPQDLRRRTGAAPRPPRRAGRGAHDATGGGTRPGRGGQPRQERLHRQT